MIVDFHRSQGNRDLQLDLENDRLPGTDDPRSDELFAKKWRAELIEKTLRELRNTDKKVGSHLYDVLQLRIAHPKMRSPELAETASKILVKHISADNYRGILRRARIRFASLLIEEVSQTLSSPSREELENELGELRLLEYCQPALDQ